MICRAVDFPGFPGLPVPLSGWYPCPTVYVGGYECRVPRDLSAHTGVPLLHLPYLEPWQGLLGSYRAGAFLRGWDMSCLCPIDIARVAALRGFQVLKIGHDFMLTKPETL